METMKCIYCINNGIEKLLRKYISDTLYNKVHLLTLVNVLTNNEQCICKC